MSRRDDPRSLLTPITRRLLENIERAGHPALQTLSPDQAKAAYEAGAGVLEIPPQPLARVDDLRVPTRDGQTLLARLFAPASEQPLPVLLFFHGGGFTVGSVATHGPLCRQLAYLAQCAVVSVDYRLAPEHLMPTAAEDAYAATVWLAAQATRFGADGSRIAVAGDSAGGNLAAVVALLARDRGGPPIAHQVLIYPGTDGTLSSPSLEENASGPILTLASVRTYRSLYLGPDGDDRDVRISPLLAEDLSGLPPALVQGAELDPIRDDARRYSAALSAAGNDVRYTEYAGAPHGYLSIPGGVRGARPALAEIVDQLKAHLHQRF